MLLLQPSALKALREEDFALGDVVFMRDQPDNVHAILVGSDRKDISTRFVARKGSGARSMLLRELGAAGAIEHVRLANCGGLRIRVIAAVDAPDSMENAVGFLGVCMSECYIVCGTMYQNPAQVLVDIAEWRVIGRDVRYMFNNTRAWFSAWQLVHIDDEWGRETIIFDLPTPTA